MCGHKEVGGNRRVWDGMSAIGIHQNQSISINPVICLIRLLCLQVYLFWCSATLQPFKIWFVVAEQIFSLSNLDFCTAWILKGCLGHAAFVAQGGNPVHFFTKELSFCHKL